MAKFRKKPVIIEAHRLGDAGPGCPADRAEGGAMNPKMETLAFRVWAYCTPRGWDCTSVEIAEALDVSTRRVTHIVREKGWANRVRAPDRSGAERLRSYIGRSGVGGLHVESVGSFAVACSVLEIDRERAPE